VKGSSRVPTLLAELFYVLEDKVPRSWSEVKYNMTWITNQWEWAFYVTRNIFNSNHMTLEQYW